MAKVLILGAGMVARPIVRFLLEEGIEVTVASRTVSKAEELVDNHKNGQAIGWSVENKSLLSEMVHNHDVIVSLLPYAYHVEVARECLKHQKHMVTTSYISEEMKKLHHEALNQDILILNEIGLDPGIDHMSAMRIIDHVHENGGKVKKFFSFCGALPAPESSDNPFKYKFSWSPRGVLLAGNNSARYLMNNQIVEVSEKNLFKDVRQFQFPHFGEMEVYPNRNSLPYIQLYGLEEADTVMRGTIRYPGWSAIMDAYKKLDLLSESEPDLSRYKTYAEWLAFQTGFKNNKSDLKSHVAQFLDTQEDSRIIQSLEYISFFGDELIPDSTKTHLDMLANKIIDKLMIQENDRDMVLMLHHFTVEYPGQQNEIIRSSMIDYGSPAQDTAVARTVALPAAVAVKMILENKIPLRGVHIPNNRNIYEPVLNELENLGIKMVEEFHVQNDSTFKN